MADDDQRRPPLIGVVGPCCAGKTTLVNALLNRGISARVIAQEHSFAPRMWQIITRPTWLVYLDVSFDVAQQRRWMNWTPADLDEQHRRLGHARAHCHVYISTDGLAPAQVLEQTLAGLALPSSPPVV